MFNSLSPAEAAQVEQLFKNRITPVIQNYLDQHPLPPNPEEGRTPIITQLPSGYGNPTMNMQKAPPPNSPLKVSIKMNKTMGKAPFTVTLKAILSGGKSSFYRINWNFGDGTVGKGVQVTHTYSTLGDFNANVSVFGDQDYALTSTKLTAYSPQDSDYDGMPDYLENKLDQFFIPYYYISAGEQPLTGFATFQDRSDIQQVLCSYSSRPPISHFQVRPLWISNGYCYCDITCLTLWNQDDGLYESCGYAIWLFGIGDLMAGMGDHPLDNEFSQVLLRAPIENNNYNEDASAYHIIRVITAAHFGTTCDQSRISIPIDYPPEAHVNLWQSVSKHATYMGNPDGHPLLPQELITAIFWDIELYLIGGGDPLYYIYLLAEANTMCYGCIVDRFFDQGISKDTLFRINVGNIDHPAGGCKFIKTEELGDTLSYIFWN